MELVPIFLLGISAFYSLVSSIFWLIDNQIPLLFFIRGLFGGVFYASIQLIILVTALAFSVDAVVTKNYSNKSAAVGMIFVTAAFSASPAIRLIGYIMNILKTTGNKF